MRKKTSIIWKSSREEFQEICKRHTSLADILREFNLHPGAGNYKTLKRRIEEDKIDITHIPLGLSSNKGRGFMNYIPASTYLNANSNISGDRLKQKLIKEKILEEVCSACGLKPIWNDKKLVLQIDHINGDSKDNRIENLRLLCPNCHSQTDTFAGKKLKKTNKCNNCSKKISKESNLCLKCSFEDKEKISWPSDDELSKMVWKKSLTDLSKELKVSDSVIRKRCKKRNIQTPPRGYWIKKAP